MIASVGLLVMMQDASRIVFGEQGITFHRNAFAFTTFNFSGVTVSAVQIAIVMTAAVVFTGLHLFTTRTRIGIGWRATVSRPQIAASFGIDPIKVRYLNFAVGSALAAVAGGLVGTLIASLVLGLVEAYGTIFIGAWLDRDAIAFLALIVLLMIRPQGFTGARTA